MDTTQPRSPGQASVPLVCLMSALVGVVCQPLFGVVPGVGAGFWGPWVFRKGNPHRDTHQADGRSTVPLVGVSRKTRPGSSTGEGALYGTIGR
jgi:hypothetical protein